MTLATITLKSDDLSPVFIGSLIVRVFNTGGVFVTSGSTNSSGVVVFDLPDADYDLTFFKMGVAPTSGQPQRITVSVSDPDVPPNTYVVIAHITTRPESSDPLLCRISGTIRGIDGSNAPAVHLAIGMDPEVAVLSGVIISPADTVAVYSDDTGYFEFDLLRGMKYRIYFPQLFQLFNVEPAMVLSLPPNLPAIDLKDLLFPVPVTANFEELTLALSVGGIPDDSIGCTITYSDGSVNSDGIRPVPPYFTGVTAVSDQELIVDAVFSVDKLIITPKSAGTANITITRQVSTTLIAYDPLPSFTSQTLVVTVT